MAARPPPAHGRSWSASIGAGEGVSAAREAARIAAAAGVENVGLLLGSKFAGVRHRTFVVFSGVYLSEEDAQEALGRVHNVYPHAFVRELTRIARGPREPAFHVVGTLLQGLGERRHDAVPDVQTARPGRRRRAA